jgi:diguanylate cyclase (GGDEF)-like protein
MAEHMGFGRRTFIAILFSICAVMTSLYLVTRIPGMAPLPSAYFVYAFFAAALVCFFAVSGVDRLAVRLERVNAELSRTHDALNQAHEDLKVAAASDALTKLLNRRAFLERVEEILLSDKGWMLLLDVDHFKRVNDTYGHAAGDRALQAVGEVLRDVVRAQDVVGRLGGEEFAACLPGVSREMAFQSAERIRQTIQSTQVDDGFGTLLALTVSIGMARASSIDLIGESLRQADLAMYQAKEGGRNQVVVAA